MPQIMLKETGRKPGNTQNRSVSRPKHPHIARNKTGYYPASHTHLHWPATVAAAVLIVLLIPSTGFCWGPISHIDIATEILNYSKLLVPQVMELIRTYPYDFLYGNIGADIVIGKNFTEYEYHCHNWLIADLIFKSARNDHQKAFAYGYISHLASDVIAHNYFVPNMIITMYRKRLFLHSYWEMRFDKMISDNAIAVIEKTFQFRHSDNNDLLKHTLEKTLFSFSTNKKLFHGLMFVNRRKLLRDIFKGFTSDRRWQFSLQEFNEYRIHSIDAIFDVLNNGEKSLYMKFDPTGIEVIHIASQIRRQLIGLHRKKKLSERDIQNIKNTILPDLAPGLYSHQKGIKIKSHHTGTS